jgi:hypothetical protein
MKLFLLVPDGTGIRNFVYTDFIRQCIEAKINVSIWASSSIVELTNVEIEKIMLPKINHTNTLIEIKRRAWQNSLLKYFDNKFNDSVYSTYIFPSNIENMKNIIKNIVRYFFEITHKDEFAIKKLKLSYENSVRKTAYYNMCKKTLETNQPDILFCTHQRSSEALGPMLAAKDLGIKTICFIYSWDNVPKATLYVSADYYFVWSEYMKNELVKLHPELNPKNVLITGTPQFSIYSNKNEYLDRIDFAKTYNLNSNFKWICYSGDDITTSPLDQEYLNDLCESVLQWNQNHFDQLHILFRKCPSEISNRYNDVIEKYNEIITVVNPLWVNLDNEKNWNCIVPTVEDNKLLLALVNHCAMVVNIASTMALDFGIKNKPCIYINYEKRNNLDWSVRKIYNFIHFRSIGNGTPVIWLKELSNWHKAIYKALYDNEKILCDNKIWLQTLCASPFEKANERIVSNLINLF